VGDGGGWNKRSNLIQIAIYFKKYGPLNDFPLNNRFKLRLKDSVCSMMYLMPLFMILRIAVIFAK